MIPLERSLDLAVARAEILRVIRSLGLRHELSVAGRRVFAAKCRLYDSFGCLAASGLGKGDEQSAITGALFEAMEHYFTKAIFLNLEHLPSSSFSANEEGVIPNLLASVIHQSHEGNIPCVAHRCLANDEDFLYPLGLFMPNYIDAICDDLSLNPEDTYDYSRLS